MTHVYLPNINVQFVNDKGKLSEAGYRFLYFLWERTGGHEDAVTTSEDETTYFWTTAPFSGDSDTKFISTTIDITTQGNAIVVATAPITVTLNPNPKDEEKVTIKRATATGVVVVSGGSNTLDGDSTYTLVSNYEAAQCIYSSTDNEWFII